MRARAFIALGILVLVAVQMTLWLRHHHAALPLAAVDFTLTDQDGKPRSSAEWRGKLVLVYFGFSHCSAACPTALAKISEALEKLGDRAKDVQPLFISIDPERDTPARLKEYLKPFHPSFTALTGSQAQLDAVTRAFGVEVRQMEVGGDIMFDHTVDIFLMDKEGRVMQRFPVIVTAQTIADTLPY